MQLHIGLARATHLCDSGNPTTARARVGKSRDMAAELGLQARPLLEQIDALGASLP